MGRIKALVGGREAKFAYRRIPDVVEYIADQLHLGVFGGQSPAELNERTAGQIIFFLADVQGIAPPDVEAEGVQGLLIAQVVPLLQETQAQKTGNAEIGTACCAVEHRIAIFVSEQDWKNFESKQVSP